MPNVAFEERIAVRLALLQKPQIVYMRRLFQEASTLRVGNGGPVPVSEVVVFIEKLSNYLRGTLTLVHTSQRSSPDEWIGPHSNMEPNAVEAIQGLGALGEAFLQNPPVDGQETLKIVQRLLGRLCELIDSLHAARRFSDGCFWGDFNAGWATSLANHEYDPPWS